MTNLIELRKERRRLKVEFAAKISAIDTPAGWCLIRQMVVPAAGKCDCFWKDDFLIDSGD